MSTCPRCGHLNLPSARFCLSCGAQLAEEPSALPATPAPPEEHTLAVVAFAAVNARFAMIPQGGGARDLLDAVAPDQLVIAVREGRRRGTSEFQLGPHTQQAFVTWADTTLREIDSLRAAWADADGRDRGLIVEGFKAGLMSDEAQVGAALGSLLGPLGMTVGAAVGGLFAGNRLDEDLQRSVTAFATAVDAWYDASVERYNALVPAAAAQDEQATQLAPSTSNANQPLGCAGWAVLAGFGLGVVAVLGGLGYGGFRVYEWIVEPGVEAATVAPVVPDAPAAPAPVLETSWTADDGVSYTLERRGPELAFLVADEATAGGRYRAGETVYVLTEDGTGAYLVSHVVRPEPPTGAAYQEAAFADCARTVTTLDGAPLRARRTSTGFELDVAVIELPARGFERGARRAQIVGCSGLGEAAPYRRTIRLSPVVP